MHLSSSTPHRRGRASWSRLWAVLPVVGLLLVGAGVALAQGERTGRTSEALELDWRARSGGQQVLGGDRMPGVPSIQRLRHDRVTFTVTVAPARPGPNLVRVDRSRHEGHRRGGPVLVGTSEGSLVPARPRPGSDGLFAVVDLPEDSATVLVTHGPAHRVPFAVDTGETRAAPVWSGPDGPECLAAASATLLAGELPTSCPSTGLADPDASALREAVDTVLTRGVTQLAVLGDDSARSDEAERLVADLADAQGVDVVDASTAPAHRSALLVVSGW